MGKKRLTNPNQSRIQTQDVYFFIAYVIAFKISTLMYEYSLQGGDVKFVTSHLVDFGISLALSILSTLVLTIIPLFFFDQINAATKVASLAAGWLIFMNSAVSDLSTTLIHHGQYNLTAFILG